MHRFGFSYKKTSKVKVAFDNNYFVAQRVFYFRKLDELRKAGALVMFHDDETWVNIGEEKMSIWIDERRKSGQLGILFDITCIYLSIQALGWQYLL